MLHFAAVYASLMYGGFTNCSSPNGEIIDFRNSRSGYFVQTTMSTDQEVNVSLEDHLLDRLNAVLPILPENLGQSLEKCLHEPSCYIPYSILTDISKWSRTDEGQATLKAKELDPASYTTVALLAGTLTSPERKFGSYVPPRDPDEIAADRARERKAITALANSMLSVIGVGVGAYWASEKTGWKNEWVCVRFQYCLLGS
jgi:hypothetical protein